MANKIIGMKVFQDDFETSNESYFGINIYDIFEIIEKRKTSKRVRRFSKRYQSFDEWSEDYDGNEQQYMRVLLYHSKNPKTTLAEATGKKGRKDYFDEIEQEEERYKDEWINYDESNLNNIRLYMVNEINKYYKGKHEIILNDLSESDDVEDSIKSRKIMFNTQLNEGWYWSYSSGRFLKMGKFWESFDWNKLKKKIKKEGIWE